MVSIDTPVARLLADYRDYLLRERGLTAGSVAHWERVARWFLAERSQPLEDALWQLTTGEVTGFVVARCAPWRCSGSTAKILTGRLRSLLRYLHVAGSPRSRWRRRATSRWMAAEIAAARFGD